MQVLEHHSLPFKLRKYFEKQRMVWFHSTLQPATFYTCTTYNAAKQKQCFYPFPSDISEVPNQADHLGTHATFHT